MTLITVFIFILLLPTIQKIFRWFLPVGFRIRVSNSDVDYGVSMDLTQTLNGYATLCLQSVPPLIYLIF